MSNPKYGIRFINDGAAAGAGTKKQRAETDAKIFQGSKMKKRGKKYK